MRTVGELVELATTQSVSCGLSDPLVADSLRRFADSPRRFADSLRRLDLTDRDRGKVEEFAASVAARPAGS